METKSSDCYRKETTNEVNEFCRLQRQTRETAFEDKVRTSSRSVKAEEIDAVTSRKR